MKTAYPIIITKTDDDWMFVDIPDFGLNTQGKTIAEAIDMAQDLIEMMGVDMQDNNEELPAPTDTLPKTKANETATFVLVDFDAYRKANEQRTVRKSVTIPSWLNVAAEKKGLNFSKVLQDGLKTALEL